MRWTLKTASGQVKDLDSETVLEENEKTYHIAASYDGRYMMLYINGRPESFTPFSGDIHTSPVDLEIGQILPDDVNYSFRGVLDEIKIYDYALWPDSVAVESGNVMTGISDPTADTGPDLLVFPNPTTNTITIVSEKEDPGTATIKYRVVISDSQGRIVLQQATDDLQAKRLDVSALDSGMYILHITGSQKTWTRAFVIE